MELRLERLEDPPEIERGTVQAADRRNVPVELGGVDAPAIDDHRVLRRLDAGLEWLRAAAQREQGGDGASTSPWRPRKNVYMLTSGRPRQPAAGHRAATPGRRVGDDVEHRDDDPATRPDSALQANLARLDPLLDRLRADGIGHLIDGGRSRLGRRHVRGPHAGRRIDDLPGGARRRGRRRPGRARRRSKAFPEWRDSRGAAPRPAARDRRRDRGAAPTTSPCSRAWTPASRSASCRRRRCAARRTSASTPIARRVGARRASRCRPRRTSTTRRGRRSARSA